jgi:PKD repeat protein
MIAEAAEPDTYSIDIQGAKSVLEGTISTFAAFIPDRPVRDESSLYSPRLRKPTPEGQAEGVRYYTATGYTPMVLIWDFGDGSPLVTIKERTSASHIYADNGDYEVTVIALDQLDQFAKQTHSVHVLNRDPEDVTITSTVLDANSHLVELGGTAMDAEGDTLNFRWDFGDGQSVEGAEDAYRTVQHQYSQPGNYEVTLTITDDDFPWSSQTPSEWYDGQIKTTYSLDVIGDSAVPPLGYEEVDPSSAESPLHGRLIAQTGGALTADFDGKIKSLAGMYLSPVESGACRFMFTAWDNAHLASAMAVIDLFGMPPEGGRFRISKPQFLLAFQANAEVYRKMYRSPLGALGGFSIPGMNLTNRALQQIDDPEGDGNVDVSQLGVSEDDFAVNIDTGNAANGSPQVAEKAGFATQSGELVLDFVPGQYAVGKFDVIMTSSDKPYNDQPLHVQAEIALDLRAAASDGIVRRADCEGLPLKITDIWPASGTVHMPVPRPRIRVEFNDRVDPLSLTDDRVQLQYQKSISAEDQNVAGAMVQVPSRLMRDDHQVFLVPEKALKPGVEYLMRIKAGDDGLRSLSGMALVKAGDSDWYEWRFSTALDLVPETNGDQLLACHLYQPARDVPLILGKPAMARIHANWEAVAGVYSSTQTTDFRALVKLVDSGKQVFGSVDMTFVRPDRLESRNVDKRRAAHTAQIPFTPTAKMKPPLYVDVLISPEAGREPLRRYRARCPVNLWDREPSLSIAFFALQFDEWAEYPDRLQALMPVLQSVADESLVYARQQFPFSTISGEPVRVLIPLVEIPSMYPVPSMPYIWACGAGCIISGAQDVGFLDEWSWGGIEQFLFDESDADVIIVFGPHDRLGGGDTTRRLPSGRGLAMVLAGGSSENFPRYVHGLVHELGHILSLQHIPFVESTEERAQIQSLRESGVPFRYEGTEAMRFSGDGSSWWNKSSAEGNEEGNQLFPLMFPSTIPEDEAFIANHQYRKIQHCLEDLNKCKEP